MTRSRHILAHLAIVVGTLVAFAPTVLAAPTLKPLISVASDIVTVGDLIEDAGSAAGEPLFQAPDLGTSGTVAVSLILKRARSVGVDGVRTKGVTEVIVSRPARSVAQADIVRALAAEIARVGALDAAALDIVLDQPIATMQANGLSSQPIRILDTGYVASNGRFDATVAIDVGGRMQQVKLRGGATEMADVVMLDRALQKGDILDRDSVTTQRMPRRQAARIGRILAEDIIGQAARRPLRAGQPVQSGDFGPPIIVAKGERVTIQLVMPGVTLSLRGVAQDAGGRGDLIGVLNETSKRVVQGTIAGSGLVTVSVAPSVATLAKAGQ